MDFGISVVGSREIKRKLTDTSDLVQTDGFGKEEWLRNKRHFPAFSTQTCLGSESRGGKGVNFDVMPMSSRSPSNWCPTSRPFFGWEGNPLK